VNSPLPPPFNVTVSFDLDDAGLDELASVLSGSVGEIVKAILLADDSSES